MKLGLLFFELALVDSPRFAVDKIHFVVSLIKRLAILPPRKIVKWVRNARIKMAQNTGILLQRIC